MKVLFFALLIPCLTWAGPGRDTWRKADKKTRAELLVAYQQWFSAHAEKNAGKFADWQAKKTTYLQIFAEAWATEGMDCIYAGWPSKKSGQSCMSPATQNPDYNRGGCASSQMQCQPLLFGAGLCVNVTTRSERNSAFSNCSARFQASGRTTAFVIEEAATNGKEAQLLSLLDFADQICASGTQAGSGMCTRLKRRVATLREQIGDAEVEVVTTEDLTAVEEAAIVDLVRLVPTLTIESVEPSSGVRACVNTTETISLPTFTPPTDLMLTVPDFMPIAAAPPEAALREVAAENSCFQNLACQPWDAAADADASQDELHSRAQACENAAHELGQGHPCFLTIINSVSTIGNNMELKRQDELRAADQARQAEYDRQVAAHTAEAERAQRAYEVEQAEYRRRRQAYELEMRALGLEPEPESSATPLARPPQAVTLTAARAPGTAADTTSAPETASGAPAITPEPASRPAPPQARPLNTGSTERSSTERAYNSLPPAHNRPPALPVVDRGAAIYSPQTAFSDVLAEPLEFVGRGYTNPILDEAGTPIEGNNTCIYRNSRVYVVHSGCRPRANQALAVFDMRIYSREGGMVAVNIESPGSGNYSIDEARPNFRGGWSIEQRATAALADDLTFTQMGDIHEDSLLNSVHICSAHGRPPFCSARGNTPAPAAMTQAWSEAATGFAQDVTLLRRVHDAVLNSRR